MCNDIGIIFCSFYLFVKLIKLLRYHRILKAWIQPVFSHIIRKTSEVVEVSQRTEQLTAQATRPVMRHDAEETYSPVYVTYHGLTLLYDKPKLLPEKLRDRLLQGQELIAR